MKSRADVVITGLGAVTPAGVNVEQTWASLVRAERKVSTLRLKSGAFWCSYPAAAVKDFTELDSFPQADRSVQFALCAGREALKSAGLLADPEHLRATGCVFSMSKPAPEAFAQAFELYCRTGSLGEHDLVREIWPNACADYVGEAFGLIGPYLCSPAACATGAHAVIQAVGLILDGQSERVLAGASEASLTPLYLGAFARMGVLALDTVEPGKACKPFDRRRRGFVPGEGAAAVVVESAESAEARGAEPLARIRGYWQGMHAMDALKLEPDGRSLAEGIKRALQRSGLAPRELDYISAHGTGTVANDASETAAIKRALGPAARQVSISSQKGAIGHLLAAAGAIQIVLAVKSIQDSLVAPTVNLSQPDPLCDLDYTASQARHRPVNNVLSITGGFGGQCGLLVLGRSR